MAWEKPQICVNLSNTVVSRKHVTLKWLNISTNDYHTFHLGHPSLSAMSPLNRALTTSYSSLEKLYVYLVPSMRYSLRQVRNRFISLLLLRLTPRRRSSPGTISTKFFTEVRGWPRYTAVKKYCRTLQPLSRVHKHYIRHTTDRRQTYLR